jgi:amino acid permease
VNVTKGIIGSGMLALPLALKDASVVPGLVCMALFALASAFSYSLIGYCCAATGSTTFHGLWSATVGSKSTWAIQGSIMVDTIFTLWAYSTLVADFLGKAFQALLPDVAILQSRYAVLTAIAVFVFAPFCFSRSLDSLKFTSALGLLATVYTLLYVIGDFVVSDEGLEHFQADMFNLDIIIFKSISLFAFAFLCHYNGPQVYAELEDRSPRRFNIVTASSFAAAFLIYALFAVCGFGRFGPEIEGNVLKNYGKGNKAVLLMWVAMACSVIFTFPLIFATLKENIYGLMGTDERTASVTSRLTIVIVGVSSTVTLGAVFEDVSLIMGICGAVVSAAIAFIYPGMIYLKLPPSAVAKGYGGPGFLQKASYALIVTGVLASVIGLYATISEEMEN